MPRYPERLSSEAAAVYAHNQLQSQFGRLEAAEVAYPSHQNIVRFNDRLIFHGYGRQRNYPDDMDSVGRYEFRKDVQNGNITYAEFQTCIPSNEPGVGVYAGYTRFRLPGWTPVGDTPRVVMDSWQVPLDHNRHLRERSTGRHIGAMALGKFTYGRDHHNLDQLSLLPLFANLAKLEDGVKYHIDILAEDQARLDRVIQKV